MNHASSPRCLVCDSTATSQHLTQNGYAVYRCTECGFQFVHPTPTPAALAHFYDQHYAVPLERYARNIERNEGRIADLERWCAERGRLLEVGASYGHSLALARTRGWEVCGVELAPTAAAYAREHFGLDVCTADVRAAEFAPASFDAIMLWHVLEHTHNPREQLEHLWTLLKPGGVLGLRVPNITSLGSRLAGRSWPWMGPPAHLWYFSPATLPRLLTRCGYTIVDVATLRGDGNNLYQHAIIAAGGRLNALRRRLTTDQPAARSAHGAPPQASPTAPQLVGRWHTLLARTQPVTDALARWTHPLVGWLDTHGGGDELLVYARRPH